MLLACTDEDLVIMLNEKLFVEHRISYRTFQRYKRRAMKSAAIPDADPLYLDLFFILKQAYVELRRQMLKAMQADSYRARRYTWIMERKFREWNLKWNAPVEEVDDDDEGPIIEEEVHYPTLVGKYHDINNTERPKDIMPVHYAVFNRYVLPTSAVTRIVFDSGISACDSTLSCGRLAVAGSLGYDARTQAMSSCDNPPAGCSPVALYFEGSAISPGPKAYSITESGSHWLPLMESVAILRRMFCSIVASFQLWGAART